MGQVREEISFATGREVSGVEGQMQSRAKLPAATKKAALLTRDGRSPRGALPANASFVVTESTLKQAGISYTVTSLSDAVWPCQASTP